MTSKRERRRHRLKKQQDAEEARRPAMKYDKYLYPALVFLIGSLAIYYITLERVGIAAFPERVWCTYWSYGLWHWTLPAALLAIGAVIGVCVFLAIKLPPDYYTRDERREE